MAGKQNVLWVATNCDVIWTIVDICNLTLLKAADLAFGNKRMIRGAAKNLIRGLRTRLVVVFIVLINNHFKTTL